MSEVNYRQQWAEGEIEAGTLLDAIDLLEHEKELMCQSRGVAAYERDKTREEHDAALAELAALKGGQEPIAVIQQRDLFPSAHWSSPEPTFVWAAGFTPEMQRAIPDGTRLYTAPPVQASAWVPEGWRLVPIQMTDEMRDAGNIYTLNRGTLVRIWAAMLAAAPTPGASEK